MCVYMTAMAIRMRDDMILMKNPLFLEEAGSARTTGVASPAA